MDELRRKLNVGPTLTPKNRGIPLGVLIAVLGLFCSLGPEYAAAQTLVEASFDNDIQSWQIQGDPGGNVAWDSTIGNPAPGSLEIFGPGDSSQSLRYEATTGQCFPVEPGQTLVVQGNYLPNSPTGRGFCLIEPVLFTEPDCQGSRTVTGNVPSQPNGVWGTAANSVVVGSSTTSVRLDVVLIPAAVDAQSICHFDQLSLVRQQSQTAVAIPAMSRWALFLLMVSLIMLVLLQRRI